MVDKPNIRFVLFGRMDTPKGHPSTEPIGETSVPHEVWKLVAAVSKKYWTVQITDQHTGAVYGLDAFWEAFCAEGTVSVAA